MANEEIRQRLSQVVKRVCSDEQLKQRLLKDPEPLLRENGIEIPEGMKPRVVVDKESISFEFVPQTAESDELTENALGAVVGGGTNTKSSSTSTPNPYLTFTFNTVYTSKQ